MYQHQLVVALVVGERREVEGWERQEPGEGAGHPAGRVLNMFGGRVVAQRDEQVRDSPFGAVQVDGLLTHDPEPSTPIVDHRGGLLWDQRGHVTPNGAIDGPDRILGSLVADRCGSGVCHDRRRNGLGA
jgi:hypothetical protein